MGKIALISYMLVLLLVLLMASYQINQMLKISQLQTNVNMQGLVN